MPNRVLLVNETAIARDERAWLEAKSLAQAGFVVSVVSPKGTPDQPESTFIDGVRVWAYPAPRRAHGFLGYAWELAYCWIRSTVLALRIAAGEGFDVVHACNPPDTFFLLAALFKPFGKKFVFAQHDLVPELWYSRFAQTGTFGRVVHSALLGMEWLSYKTADAVIVPNESYREVALSRGKRRSESVFVVRNGPDLDKVHPADPDSTLKNGRAHLVCYLGIMNPQDGVDYLLRAAAHLVHGLGRQDTQFALVGSGDMIDELKALARQLDIEEYVTFAGWISEPNALSRYLCTADVCVAPDPKTPLNEVSSFMKIMDYMAVGRPIVAFDLRETRVSAQGAASYARPDDVEDFAERISTLLDDGALRASMGEIGRGRIAASLSWKHQESRLFAVYEFLLGELPLTEGSASDREPVPILLAEPRIPVVSIDTLDGKRGFLDFWRLPHAENTDGDVALVSADGFEDSPSNSVVLLTANGAPQLCAFDNGCAVFAPIRGIESVPDGLEVVTRLIGKRGETVSYVLSDPARHVYYVPFSLDDAFAGFELERYAMGKRFPPQWLLSMYYAIKPALPASLQAWSRHFFSRYQEERSIFPTWPIDERFENLKRFILSLLVKASRGGELPFVWFWPEGKESCLVLTHDIESKLSDNSGIWRLINAEKTAGFTSSFNIVPFKYPVAEADIARIRAEGCEVGVHGYSHNGDLFRERAQFPARAEQIMDIARKWGARGFRSTSTFRDPELLSSLRFDYDLSYFDTDPYEPQPGGCLSLYPYFIGDMVEIPMTLPQDHTLFVVRGDSDIQTWREKISAITRLNAMACLNAHPDEGYVGDAKKVARYSDFLSEFAGREDLWNPRAGELASWWRDRRSAALQVGPDGVSLDASDPRMCVRWARVDGNVVDFATSSARAEV